MQIESFCLCESAGANEKQQPSLLNIFDARGAVKEPSVIEPFVVALVLRVYQEDEGQHRFSISVKNSSKQDVFPPITEVFSVSKMFKKSVILFFSYTVPGGRLLFGEYEFEVEIDQKLRAHTPLYLVQSIQENNPRF